MATVNFGGYALPVYDPKQLTWSAPHEIVNSMGDTDQTYLSYLPGGLRPAYDPSLAWADNTSNWALMPYYTDPDYKTWDDSGFTAMLKTADKEGTRFRYALQNGQYVPVEELGKQYWDSNSRLMSQFGLAAASIIGGGMLAAAAAPGGGAGAAGSAAGSAAPSMTTYGLLDTSLALPGTTFVQGVAPVAGMTAADYAAAYGPSVGEPISYSGMTNGIGSLGSGWGMPGGVVAGEGGAATFGGASGLASTGLWDTAKNYVTDPKNIPTLIKAGSMIGGLLGDNGSSSGGSGSGVPMNPVPPPTMYGQGSPSGGLLGGSWGALGPTETERRMRQQYLPSLLGSGPWSN